MAIKDQPLCFRSLDAPRLVFLFCSFLWKKEPKTTSLTSALRAFSAANAKGQKLALVNLASAQPYGYLFSSKRYRHCFGLEQLPFFTLTAAVSSNGSAQERQGLRYQI